MIIIRALQRLGGNEKVFGECIVRMSWQDKGATFIRQGVKTGPGPSIEELTKKADRLRAGADDLGLFYFDGFIRGAVREALRIALDSSCASSERKNAIRSLKEIDRKYPLSVEVIRGLTTVFTDNDLSVAAEALRAVERIIAPLPHGNGRSPALVPNETIPVVQTLSKSPAHEASWVTVGAGILLDRLKADHPFFKTY